MAAHAVLSLAAFLFWSVAPRAYSETPGETRAQYEERLELIVRANAEAAYAPENRRGWSPRHLALAVTVVMRNETLFDQRIHEGIPHPKWHSDYGRAKCLGQLHKSRLVPEREWAELAGAAPDRTRACAAATTRVWVAQAQRCGVWYGRQPGRQEVAQVFAAYATGGNCKPGDRDYRRADEWLSMVARDPHRGFLKGYRRALPSEAPELPGLEAPTVEPLYHVAPDGRRYAVTARYKGTELVPVILVEGK